MRFLPLVFLLTSAIAAETPNRTVVSIAGSTGGKVLNRCLGFIVEKEDFVLTNYENLTSQPDGRLLVKFAVTLGEKSYTAEIIGVEPTINIGILKLETDETFTPVVCAVKREITPGMALHAGSLENGVLETIAGSVTALNTKLCYQHILASTMFRAKTPIPEASLGGPVFFADSGEVAAIFTGYKPVPEPGLAEDTSETHLLPINLCFNIYESLKTKRSLKSPWNGFSVRPLNENEQRHFPTAKKHRGGVAIEDVWDNSPAQKLGIKAGDILVQFSYRRILSVAGFQKWLYMYGMGQPVKLIILRNGTEYLMTDYVIDERPQLAKPK